MPFICYKAKNFRAKSLLLIEQANEIIDDYMQQGYQLTLRQLYYQFVSKALIENTMRSYNKLGSVINDGRLAGLIDWDSIEDRTRNVQSVSHWTNPKDIVETCANQFRVDKWKNQNYRVEVWIEKEALAGVIEPICRKLDVSFLACKGYTSQSEMWVAGQRLKQFYDDQGQRPVIIHLGDHDPSGIDMTRDISDRLRMFNPHRPIIERIALNYDQIEEYKPPPNPAKMTDSRFQQYQIRFGDESWELDALDPKTLSRLIEKTVLKYRDNVEWNAMVNIENDYRDKLGKAANEYNWE